MTETMNLNLPLLSPSQAQKHVTMNEALARLDGMVQLRLISVSQATPPGAVLEGSCYGVPVGAVNDWTGHSGQVALYSGGGWVFATPVAGWRAWVVDQGGAAVHDGSDWRVQAATLTPGGAGMNLRSVEMDVSLGAGATVATGLFFPSRAIILGVTGRVISEITGTATSWSLGDAGSSGRFGSGLGMAQNSWLSGPSNPFVVWSDTEITMTASGGDFAAGQVRLAAHYLDFALPAPV